MTPGGIYVHLPYCASRCGYCAFVVTTDGSSRDRYLDALDREAKRLGVTRQSIIKIWLAERLERTAHPAA